jgi:hypothetical protein
MKLAIMQPFVFPYIGYFQAINAVDKYILYDRLNYIKKKWMNRNRILIVNRDPCYFVIPLKEKSSYKKIYQIQLEPSNSWRSKILNQVNYNYKKSPFFSEVFPLIEKVILFETDLLHELNNQSIIETCNYLEIKTIIGADASVYDEIEEKLNYYEDDLPSGYPNIYLYPMVKKIIRVLEICRYEKADHFINAIGGTKLYSKEDFLRNGITLNFIQTKDYRYKQNSDKFFSGLSIIDVLMNCGKEQTRKLLDEYDLI